MSSSKFKKALAEAKSTVPVRVAIPQVDPGEPTQPRATQQSDVSPADTPVAVQPARDLTPATTPVDPRTLPVDTSARVMPFGCHIYPDRHHQLRYEAFMLGLKPWEVLEVALAEYFEHRYGGSQPGEGKINES
jgi:hypothetical protein